MCKFCKPNPYNEFVLMNKETTEYSGIEITIHSKGMLRCRYYGENELFVSQDVVNIKFCPFCGKEIKD